MSLAAGDRVGSYEILAHIGAGGMGDVYQARDHKLDRDVAVKVLPEHLAENPQALPRFEREAKVVAALNHPNILSIYDFGQERGIAYAATELLGGENASGTAGEWSCFGTQNRGLCPSDRSWAGGRSR